MPKIVERETTEVEKGLDVSDMFNPDIIRGDIKTPSAPGVPPITVPSTGQSPLPGNISPLRATLPLEDVYPFDIDRAYPLDAYTRRLQRYERFEERLLQAEEAAGQTQSESETASGTGTAQNITNLSVTESPLKTDTGLFSLVSVSFDIAPGDTAFGYANVWVSNYHASAAPVLVASIASSPSSFILETTGESVVVTLVSVSANGVPNDFAASPATTVVLDGVTSAPPAPSIAQSLVATPTGYQFQFTFLAGLVADLVDGYTIYRNTVNDSTTATKIDYIKQNATNTGVYTFQDANAPRGTDYYYWVSAVNTFGLESTLTAAQSGTVTNDAIYNSAGQIADTFVNNPINTASVFTGANPLSQSGTTTTINVASFTIQWGAGQVSFNSGSVDPGSYGLWYVYVDDPTYAGGAVTYLATASLVTLYAADGRLYIGSITTDAGGGGSGGGGGGGGGCPLSGAPVKLHGNKTWWTKTVLPNENFIYLKTAKRAGFFSTTDRRYTSRGVVDILLLKVGDVVLTDDGEEVLTEVLSVKLPNATVDKYEATEGHVYSAWGFIGHNLKPNPN